MAQVDPLSLDFAVRFPDSFARVLGHGELDECSRVIESLPPERRTAIVARLTAGRIRQLLETEDHRPEEWLVDGSFDDAVTLLSRIPRERRLALINGLGHRERRRQLLRHLQYPAHSVGAVVGDIALRLGPEESAADAVAELRDLEADDSAAVVVIDADGRYLGVPDLWRLLLQSPPVGLVKDYLVPVDALRPETPIATVAMAEEWHARNWLPVIDHRERVLGSVSRERLFRAAGANGGPGQRRGDIVLDLLADFVYVCEYVLARTATGEDAT